LGFFGWLFVGTYKAELVLNNNTNISLLSWRALQLSLPNLAYQMIEEGKVSDANLATYRQMSDEEWWKKNAKPTLAITKTESKELVSVKSLEPLGGSILSVTIIAKALSREAASERSKIQADFILKGGAYLAIRNMINRQQSEVLTADNTLNKKINDTQIELQYQAKRLANLEVLLKRFPNDQRISSQVVDPKESGAKYFPISTQIIAINTEINANKETLERMNDLVQQNAILKIFLAKAEPLLQDNFDGLDVTQKLLDLLGELHAQNKPDDLISFSFLSNLRTELLANQLYFTKGLSSGNIPPVVSKTGMVKTAASGLFGTFFLMLLVLLGQRMWTRIKK
jgi:hypothetical protein